MSLPKGISCCLPKKTNCFLRSAFNLGKLYPLPSVVFFIFCFWVINETKYVDLFFFYIWTAPQLYSWATKAGDPQGSAERTALKIAPRAGSPTFAIGNILRNRPEWWGLSRSVTGSPAQPVDRRTQTNPHWEKFMSNLRSFFKKITVSLHNL